MRCHHLGASAAQAAAAEGYLDFKRAVAGGVGDLTDVVQIARIVAGKLNAADGPTVLYVPLRGVSAIATEGQVFHDPEADEALFSTLRELVDASKVEVHELELDVNAPEFALAMAPLVAMLIVMGFALDRLLLRGEQLVGEGQKIEVYGATLRTELEDLERVALQHYALQDPALLEIIRGVVVANPDAVAQYRAGKMQTFGFLVGQVMKASKGKANPKLANELLKKELVG